MDETVKLDARGRLVLSDELLGRWGVKAGDALSVRLEGTTLRVVPKRVLVSGFAGRFARPAAPVPPAATTAPVSDAVSPTPPAPTRAETAVSGGS
jgi:hypothetical protein